MFEVVTFQLRDDVDPATFREFDQQIQTTFFYEQRGLQRRTTARSDDGTWITITFWNSADDADQAATKWPRSAESGVWWSCVKHASIDTRRYDTL